MQNVDVSVMVLTYNEAKNIENVFVNASGLNSRPSSASSVRTGRKETAMTSSARKLGPPTSLTAATMTS